MTYCAKVRIRYKHGLQIKVCMQQIVCQLIYLNVQTHFG